MNDSLDVPMTATIRLHQYAQPARTGVPPADRGMLMPYNVGQVTAPGDGNSIFDLATAEPYFANARPYPLPLDIGLPAFSWGVQFRNGAFVGVLQDQQVQDALSLGLLSGETNGTLQVTQENNEHMPELHLGDVVRVERMTPEVIAQVAQLARTAVNSDTLAVAYFELGTGTFQKMTKAQVKAGFDRFAPAEGAFYLYCDVAHLTNDSRDFCKRLLAEAGVAATPGVDFDRARGAGTLRLSFAGSTAEMEEAVALQLPKAVSPLAPVEPVAFRVAGVAGVVLPAR